MAVYVADLRSTTGWSERWATTEGALSTTTDGLRITKSAETNRYAVTWDTIDGDSDRDKVEVLAKVRFVAQAAATTMVGVVVRGSGASGSEDKISAVLYDAGNDGADRRLYITEVDNGTPANLSIGSAVSNVANTWYWIKVRANGTSFKAKSWADGSVEPATWTHDLTTTIDAVGWTGIYAMDTATDPYDIGYFAVATNGDSISTGASGGFFLGADF
jgi:hypothetical protein